LNLRGLTHADASGRARLHGLLQLSKSLSVVPVGMALGQLQGALCLALIS
jgi:hypothetical protein